MSGNELNQKCNEKLIQEQNQQSCAKNHDRSKACENRDSNSEEKWKVLLNFNHSIASHEVDCGDLFDDSVD